MRRTAGLSLGAPLESIGAASVTPDHALSLRLDRPGLVLSGQTARLPRALGLVAREASAASSAGSRKSAGKTPVAESGSRERAAPASGGPASATTTLIGVISDNHGYLDPAVLQAFAGVTHIIHAGDIMDPQILVTLEAVAPVTAVAGNLDSGELAARLPREARGEVGGVRFLVGHKPKRLLNRLSGGKIEGERPDLVVWGHTHVPSAAWVEGALYLNPGQRALRTRRTTARPSPSWRPSRRDCR